MTQISEIHGPIPKNEYPDRGKMVRVSVPYIPYTSLTKGEMKLALLQEQANIYAQAFPENKQYRQAAQMLDNALNKGISRGVSFVGALHDPLLQQVANEIVAASKQTAPASKNGLFGRSIASSIHRIGNPQYELDCKVAVAKQTDRMKNRTYQYYESLPFSNPDRRRYEELLKVCLISKDIERIVNDRITGASHHVLYYGLSDEYPGIKNSTVVTKHLLHIGGIAGLANATGTDRGLMSTWSETAILKQNTLQKVGPIGSIASSFNLSPNYDAYSESYAIWLKNRIYKNPKSGKIGEPLTAAAVTALVIAIGGAISSAAALLKELNAKRAGAMSAAQLYGTPSFEAKESDFNDFPQSGSSMDLTTLALVGAGAYLLLSDEK